MAKLSFSTQDLKDGLRWVTNHIDPRPTVTEDAAVLIDPIEGGKATLAGSNGSEEAYALVDATGDTLDNRVGVHAEALFGVVKTATADSVNLEFTDAELVVKSGYSTSKLPYISDTSNHSIGSDKLSQLPEARATVDGPHLTAAVLATAGIASDDASTPQLAGVRFGLEDGRVELAATDRMTLAVARVDVQSEETLHTLLPAKTLATVARNLPDGEDVRLRWEGDDPKRIILTTTNRAVKLTALAGVHTFPNYQALLQAEYGTTIAVDRRDLSGVLSRSVQAVGKQGVDSIRIAAETSDGEATEVSTSAKGFFSQEENMPARVEGDGATVGLSLKSLAAATKAVQGSETTLSVSGAIVTVTSDHPSEVSVTISRQRNV